MSALRSIIATIIFIFLLLSSCSESKTEYDRDLAIRRVLKVQQLQNLNPGDQAVVPMIEAIVDSMRTARRDACYFGAVNVLIDRLFSDGRYTEADSLAVRMQHEATEQNDSVAMAMAKRVRAQIFFKLSQSDKALDELQSALPYVDHSIHTIPEFGTATSIYEWIHIIASSKNDTTWSNHAGLSFANIVGDERIASLWNDTTGHYQATALAFKADEAMSKNDLNKASLMLDSASTFIKPNLPARAYEHFYNARAKIRSRQGNFSDALEDVDTLLSTHSRFPWFYLHDLLLKADILNDAGMHEQSTRTYSNYIAYHDSLSSKLTDSRLHDLTVLYRSEIDREQKRIHTIRMFALGGTTIMLLILLGMTLRHAIAERKRNRLLVERLQEYDRTNHNALRARSDNEESDEKWSEINKLDKFMLTDRPYTNPGLGRKDLADFMGISQEAVAQLIRKEKDCSVHAYINSFRTEEVRRILDSNSEMPIVDIATNLGFGTVRTLQRAFKERFDMSPSQYRAAAEDIRNSENQ